MVLDEIGEKYGLKKLAAADEIPTYYCPADFAKLSKELKEDFEVLLDITAVDYMDRKKKRFEVVYLFLSITQKMRLRIKLEIEEGEKVPTISHLWGNANWLEREIYDMFGIEFKGHPDLRRILLYPEFKGHPLRKDYPFKKSQPRIKFLRPERK